MMTNHDEAATLDGLSLVLAQAYGSSSRTEEDWRAAEAVLASLREDLTELLLEAWDDGARARAQDTILRQEMGATLARNPYRQHLLHEVLG